MTIIQNSIIEGKHEKPILTDVFYNATKQSKPIVIFAHGYKGFKDWGCWNLVAEHFATNNFFFVKFNFSHNGGTAIQPIDFPDLEAFGNNNYTIELDDLQSVIDWVLENVDFADEIDRSNITLIGHSRGGGISVLKASEDKRVTRLITWAAVSSFGDRSATIGELEDWKKNGVKYVLNGRTKQQMPHYFQFFENYKANETRLNIELAVKKLDIPYLIIHGTNDTSISFDEAKLLHNWNPKSEISDIKDADHTFGGKHPWTENYLPKHLQKVTTQSLDFIKNIL
jgi:pimeloyl-ACP methyl ester carboxylesterase